jgi:hypothetical protein
MNKIFHSVFIIALFLMIQGCCQEELQEKFIPKAEVEFSKQYFTLFQNENYEALEESIDNELRSPDLRGKLQQIANLFPQEEPKKIDLVGSRTFETVDKWQANLTFQYEFSKNWLIANIVLERISDGPLVVKGVNVNPIQDSLQNINKFTLKGKSKIHFVFLSLSVLIPLFIVITFIVCLRTPIKKRKWLWAIFILLGFAQCTINWTSGEIFYQLLSFNIFGAGFFYGNKFGPVMLKVAFPLGAIIFWFKRKKFYQQTVQPDSLKLAG